MIAKRGGDTIVSLGADLCPGGSAVNPPRLLLVTFVSAILSACATTGAEDISTGRGSRGAADALPEFESDYRQSLITRFARRMALYDAEYRNCPPGTEGCTFRRAAGSRPALRGSTPWMAQITLPEVFKSNDNVPIALGDWQTRHQCGGALIAPGWVLTAAHCVDDGMVAQGWRVRVGMTNLALDDGRYYPIEQVICFDPALCRYPYPDPPRPDPMYRDDIALLRFTPAPGDLAPAREPAQFEDIGIETVDIAANAGQLAMWSEDGTRRLWDIASGTELRREARPPAEILPAAPLAPGMLIGHEPMQSPISFINVPSRNLRISWSELPPPAEELLRYQLQVAAPTPTGWDVLAVQPSGYIGSIRLSPDESHFVTVSGQLNTYRVTARETASLRELWAVDFARSPTVYDYHSASSNPRVREFGAGGLLVNAFHEVLLIDPATGTVVQRFAHPNSPSYQSEHGGPPDEGQRNFVADAALSDDGRVLATVTNRYGGSDGWLWNAATGELLRRIPHEGQRLSEKLEAARLVMGGTRLLTLSEYGSWRVWETASGRPISRMAQHLPLQQARLIRQGRIAAMFDAAGISSWDLESGREVSRVDHLREVSGGTVSPDETRLLSWSEDGTARLWNIDGGAEALRIYHNGEMGGAAFMPDPAKVLTWSDDGTARITAAAGAAEMVFDAGLNPPGSPLALAAAERPASAAEVSYIPLPEPGALPEPGRLVNIFGWGKTRQPGGFEPFASLMTVDLTVLANPACADLPGMGGRQRVHSSVFCARDEEQKTCEGDSGGPVVLDGVLVGVVSWGKIGCSYDGQPGVYTNVAQYTEWIRAQIGAGGD